MSKLLRFCCLLFLIYFCTGCLGARHTYRKHQAIISKQTKKGNFDEVKYIITRKSFHRTEEDYLLKNLETGMYLFNTKKYCQAIDHFDEAYETTKLQQSTDITSGVSSWFGTGLDIYYGKIYELSLIRFFNSLANYYVFNEKRCDKYQYLLHSKVSRHNVGIFEKQLNKQDLEQKFSASRANIIEWDSFLKGRHITKDDRYYSESLLQKIWGAFIHEQRGTISDRQIALQLYKDAKDVALNRYAVYSEFNKNNQTYIANLDKIASRKIYVDSENKYVKDINAFADKQIERLKDNKRANFSILIFNDLISERKAERVNIPVNIFFKNNSLLADIASRIGVYNVSFEAPYMYNKKITDDYFYILKNKKTKNTIKNKITLIEPVSNIAYTDYLQTRASIISSIVENISNSFGGCIYYTLTTNQRHGKKGNSLFMIGKNVSYIGNFISTNTLRLNSRLLDIKYHCSSLLNYSNRIDARQWVSLPSNIFMTTDIVADGEYNIEIIRRDENGIDTTIKTQDFVIKDGNTILIQVLDYDNGNIVPKLKQ